MTTAAAKGTAVYNGDGTFTYTATAGQEGLDTFQYTITDQDGDTSTATVTVDLGTDSVPSLVSTTNLTVDEDGFALAANDAANGADRRDASTGSSDAERHGGCQLRQRRSDHLVDARLRWLIPRRWTVSCIRLTARA